MTDTLEPASGTDICIHRPRFVSPNGRGCLGRVVPGSSADQLFRSFLRKGFDVVRHNNAFFADDGEHIRYICARRDLPAGYIDAIIEKVSQQQ